MTQAERESLEASGLGGMDMDDLNELFGAEGEEIEFGGGDLGSQRNSDADIAVQRFGNEMQLDDVHARDTPDSFEEMEFLPTQAGTENEKVGYVLRLLGTFAELSAVDVPADLRRLKISDSCARYRFDLLLMTRVTIAQ